MDRNLTQDEFNLRDRNYLAGIDGIALVVHPDSPIKNLSILQAREIFEGLITNWKEVGGPNAPINVYGRKENSTTRSSIEDILMAGGTLSRRIKELKMQMTYRMPLPMISMVSAMFHCVRCKIKRARYPLMVLL